MDDHSVDSSRCFKQTLDDDLRLYTIHASRDSRVKKCSTSLDLVCFDRIAKRLLDAVRITGARWHATISINQSNFRFEFIPRPIGHYWQIWDEMRECKNH